MLHLCSAILFLHSTQAFCLLLLILAVFKKSRFPHLQLYNISRPQIRHVSVDLTGTICGDLLVIESTHQNGTKGWICQFSKFVTFFVSRHLIKWQICSTFNRSFSYNCCNVSLSKVAIFMKTNK